MRCGLAWGTRPGCPSAFGIVDYWLEPSSEPNRVSGDDRDEEDDLWSGPKEGQCAVGTISGGKNKRTRKERIARRQAGQAPGCQSRPADSLAVGGSRGNTAVEADRRDALTLVHDHGFTTIAVTPNFQATDIRGIPRGLISKPAIIVGAEGPG